jgi:hypothetical protein
MSESNTRLWITLQVMRTYHLELTLGIEPRTLSLQVKVLNQFSMSALKQKTLTQKVRVCIILVSYNRYDLNNTNPLKPSSVPVIPTVVVVFVNMMFKVFIIVYIF